MTNIEYAKNILTKLAEFGVKTIALCPGGRNAPFVALLEKSQGFEILSFYDERSASFFALGRAQRDERPVAVLTTSGTAVSELLSACIEAYYSQTPLIFLTADRPKSLRGTGAPQSIEQKDIFTNYVEKCFDLEINDVAEMVWKQEAPLHLNICFNEPLIDSPVEKNDFKTPDKWEFPKENSEINDQVSLWLENKENPLIVVGGLKDKASWSLEKTLSDWRGSLYLESSSGLRESPLLKKQIVSGDKYVQRQLSEKKYDGVLRIGDIPTAKFWRQLNDLDIPVLCVNNKVFKGLEDAELIIGEIENFDQLSKVGDNSQEQDLSFKEGIDKLLNEFPLSEPALFHKLSCIIPEEATLYLGNSLPVRLWDLFASRSKRFHTQMSRGANGIDGQISTGLGIAQEGKEHWMVLGDLTSLYDFSGLWVTEQLRKSEIKVRFVVMNNGGGQIFSRIFSQSLFLNEHQLNFRHFAEMWGWEYHKLNGSEWMNKVESNFSLLEVQPDSQQTASFWEKFDQLWKL